ncbi:MAG: helix-turn-helix transcriptional regulator [Alphaproteobacteria bacterium]|nr:helix-turn-helix transcriptional regulator [Alphaproteobacteria bacterium]
MEFSKESLTDLFLHFPGMVGIFDSDTGKLVWGNDNWTKKYFLSGNIPEALRTIVERYIHSDDQPAFLNAYQMVSRGDWESASFFIRFLDHTDSTEWSLCTFQRFKATRDHRDLICCHQSDLRQIAEMDHVREFYHDFRKHHPMPSMKNLTTRELEILKLIALGQSYTEIAARLFIQPETVNKHRKNIQNKLHLKSIALLTCFAIENGLVE